MTNIQRGRETYLAAVRAYQSRPSLPYWVQFPRPTMRVIMPECGCVDVERRPSARDGDLLGFLDQHIGPRSSHWMINGSTIWVNDQRAADFVAFYVG